MAEMKDLVRLRTKLYDEMVASEKLAINYQQKAEILRKKLNAIALAIQSHKDRPVVKYFTMSDGTKVVPTKSQAERLEKAKAASLVDLYLKRMQSTD